MQGSTQGRLDTFFKVLPSAAPTKRKVRACYSFRGRPISDHAGAMCVQQLVMITSLIQASFAASCGP